MSRIIRETFGRRLTSVGRRFQHIHTTKTINSLGFERLVEPAANRVYLGMTNSSGMATGIIRPLPSEEPIGFTLLVNNGNFVELFIDKHFTLVTAGWEVLVGAPGVQIVIWEVLYGGP